MKQRLGLDFRVSYTRELALKYYGLGNASEVPENVDLGDPRFEYMREHPTFRLRSESRFFGGALLIVGFAYTHNWITIPPGTLLAEDRESEDPRVRQALEPTGEHGVAEFTYGLGWDSRNNRVSPTSGHYHTASIILGSGRRAGGPAELGESERKLALLRSAGRAAPDTRACAESAISCSATRRSTSFRARTSRTPSEERREFAAFPPSATTARSSSSRTWSFARGSSTSACSARKTRSAPSPSPTPGRLWSDYPPDPELDGELDWENGFGLKYGVGGGLRLYGGTSFVVRADVAWSPDARPIGGYLGAGEVF